MQVVTSASRSKCNSQIITRSTSTSSRLLVNSLFCHYDLQNCRLLARRNLPFHSHISRPRPKQVRIWDCRGRSWSEPGIGLIRTMSSDDAYSSFLDQANQGIGASQASANRKTATTKVVDTEVPAELQSVEQYYTSEADEPFEPVSLKWDGSNMPSEGACPLIAGSGMMPSTETSHAQMSLSSSLATTQRSQQ